MMLLEFLTVLYVDSFIWKKIVVIIISIIILVDMKQNIVLFLPLIN